MSYKLIWFGVHLAIALCTTVDINTKQHWTDVDPSFLSVSIDASIVAHDFHRPDLNNPKLVALASGLSGNSDEVSMFLRIGGLDQDFVVYGPTGEDSFPCYILNNTEWDTLNNFTSFLGWKLVFGLNLLSETRPDGTWDPRNAMQLLRYNQGKGYKVNYQLGNEPDLFPTHENVTISPEQLARNFALLKVILLMTGDKDSLLLGPDVATLTRYNYFDKFLKNVKPNVLGAVAYHFYYGASANATLENFTDPAYLDHILSYGEKARKLIDNAPQLRGTPVWISETSSTYGGGSQTLGHAYAAGFLFLDKLGLAAQLNVSVLVKQTLVGGLYSLIIRKGYKTTPSYWIAAIYKQTVGTRVLNTSGLLTFNRKLRMYAHCVNLHGGYDYVLGDIVVFGLNLNNGTVTLSFGESLQHLAVDQFLLTPANGSLTDKKVKLNGKLLDIDESWRVPIALPVTVQQPVSFPPLSYGFFVLRNAGAHACSHNSF